MLLQCAHALGTLILQDDTKQTLGRTTPALPEGPQVGPGEVPAVQCGSWPRQGTDTKITPGQILTSEAGPLSAPGQEKVTNSWHRLCTTKQQTAERRGTASELHDGT